MLYKKHSKQLLNNFCDILQTTKKLGYILNKLQLIISIACTKTLLLKAIKIALIVGIILNLINQGEKIFILAFEDINYYKFFLTFIVPFSVSMYTAITMKLNLHVEKKQ